MATTSEIKQNLINLKKNLLEKIANEWKEYVNSFLTTDELKMMSIKELLLASTGAPLQEQAISKSKAPLKPAAKKKGVSKKTSQKSGDDSERRWTRSSIRQSIASHMDEEDCGPARAAGRGESLFSVNGSPVASDRNIDEDISRLSRRITLKGLNDDIELSCVLPTQDASAAGSKVAIEALEKEELIKMRDALKKAQEQAESLLAQYGI